MKKLLLFAPALISLLGMNAQTIPNGGFENWNPNSFEVPQYYPMTSNSDVGRLNLPYNALKVTDPQQGTYAIKLNTVTNGVDTMFGYFINGDPNSFRGGIPYNQHATTLNGFYKSNIMPGDTGFLLCIFKQAGVPVSFDAIPFTGTHSSYTPFSLTLNVPPLSSPDSIIVGAVSSAAFSNSRGIPGSMLQIDNLLFTGVTSQPTQMNGSFENWNTLTTYTPAQWSTAGDSIYRTTDAHSGTYSCMMRTFQYDSAGFSPSYITNGIFPPNSGPTGGRPYAITNDTLCGWYKFAPTGVDSATVWINTSANHVNIGGALTPLPPAATWTFFSIPFSSMSTPDTLLVVFASSYNGTHPSDLGSILKVDDVYLKSSPTAVPEIHWNDFGFVKLYPNPSNGECYFEFDNNENENVVMTITDLSGRKISEETISGTGHHSQHIDTSAMEKGMYTITLLQNGKITSRRLIVE